MEPTIIATYVGITLFSLLAIVCISGLFEEQISRIITTFFMLFLSSIQLVETGLESFWRGVRTFYQEQFTIDGTVDMQGVFFQFIGATLYTLFLTAFSFAEFHLLALSLVAVGIEMGRFLPPMGAGTLTAFSIISSFLFFGAVIADLKGVTRTAPWVKSLDEKWQAYLLYITLFALCLSLFVTVSMGLFRGKVIAEDSLKQSQYLQSNPMPPGYNKHAGGSIGGPKFEYQPPVETQDGFYYWIPLVTNISIPILIAIGGLLASWGVVTFIKFIMLIAGFIILSPLALMLIITQILDNIIDRLYQLAYATFQFLGAMGLRFFAIFGWTPPRLNMNRSQQDNEDSEDDGIGDGAK